MTQKNIYFFLVVFFFFSYYSLNAWYNHGFRTKIIKTVLIY